VQIKVGEGKYEKVPWANFSQEDLKAFAKVQKLEPLVEPFIEITQEEKNQEDGGLTSNNHASNGRPPNL